MKKRFECKVCNLINKGSDIPTLYCDILYIHKRMNLLKRYSGKLETQKWIKRGYLCDYCNTVYLINENEIQMIFASEGIKCIYESKSQ